MILIISIIILSLFNLINTAPLELNLKIPVVIWHGLGDKFDNPGLIELKKNLESRPNIGFVHLISIGKDGSSDQKSTFFGSANVQVNQVCEQLLSIPEIVSKELNPFGKFDAIGFSQGGQLLRAVIERCGGKDSLLQVRNLITLGSQHMGISSLPTCPPDSSPFSTCRLLQLSIIKEGLYSNFAQKNLIPAQYVRDENRIDDYLKVNTFLKDINNERIGDEEVGPVLPTFEQKEGEGMDSISKMIYKRRMDASDDDDEDTDGPRNATYKVNLSSLTNFIMYRFSLDKTVVPPQSAHFTLPSPNATNCKNPIDLPTCYLDPVPLIELPLYSQDYIGLKLLNERNGLKFGICEGVHMQIDKECWENVVSWLGIGDGIVRGSTIEEQEVNKFVIQL